MNSGKDSGRCKESTSVRRLCIGCYRLYWPGDISHNLRGYQCVCVGCVDDEVERNPGIDPDGVDTHNRYEGVL